MLIIGLRGVQGAGKDYWARIIRDSIHDEHPDKCAIVRSFSDVLRDHIATNVYRDLVSPEEIDTAKRIHLPTRLLMQWYGQLMRDLCGETFWLDQFRLSLVGMNVDYVIVPGVRYENEAEACDLVVEIQRDTPVGVVGHPSEMWIHNNDRIKDIIIKNSIMDPTEDQIGVLLKDVMDFVRNGGVPF